MTYFHLNIFRQHESYFWYVQLYRINESFKRTRKIIKAFQWKYEISMLKLAFGFGDGKAATDDYDGDDDDGVRR